MAIYYPQGVITMRVTLENLGDATDPLLNKLHVFSVVARRMRVSINDYTEADTFNCEIDFKNFPFDPRSIRSVGVTVHIEDKKKLFKTTNALNLINPDPDNAIFVGFADEDKIQLSEETRTVRLEGRDQTSYFIDREYTGGPIPLSKPVDQVIQDLVNLVPEVANSPNGIIVENRTGIDPLPTLAKLAPDFSSKAGTKNGRPRRTFWDQIQAIVERAGLIAYIELDKLVLSKPRNLYKREKAKLFVYGENLKELEFDRKLGRQKGFNIRVVSLVPERKEVLDAKIPEEASDEFLTQMGLPKKRIQVETVNANGEKGEPKDAPFITFRVRDVANKEQLISIGEKVFEEVGRQQIQGKLTTKEMQVCEDNGPGNERRLFNIAKARIGMPIEIDIDQGDLRGLPSLFKGKVKEREARIKKFLIERCYQEEIAVAYAKALTKFDTPFFTKAIEFELSQDTGFSASIDFLNFIELPQNLAGAT